MKKLLSLIMALMLVLSSITPVWAEGTEESQQETPAAEEVVVVPEEKPTKEAEVPAPKEEPKAPEKTPEPVKEEKKEPEKAPETPKEEVKEPEKTAEPAPTEAVKAPEEAPEAPVTEEKVPEKTTPVEEEKSPENTEESSAVEEKAEAAEEKEPEEELPEDDQPEAVFAAALLKLKKGTKIYGNAECTSGAKTLAEDYVAYAFKKTDAGFAVNYFKKGEKRTGYVKGECVPMTDAKVKEYLAGLKGGDKLYAVDYRFNGQEVRLYEIAFVGEKEAAKTGTQQPATQAAAALTVAKQPVNYVGDIGETAAFAVAVSGGSGSYTYQWQYNDSGKGWNNSGANGNKTSRMSIAITEARLTMEYRCVITDSAGAEVTSGAAHMVIPPAVEIETQPENYTGEIDEEAYFHVAVCGGTEPYTYQWQYKAKTETSWKTSGAPGNKTDTMSLAISNARLANEYRCKITDAKGKTATSKAVFMKLRTEPMKVTTQPANYTGFMGDNATFSVAVMGGMTPYTYQWQYKVKTDETWTNSGASGNKTSKMSIAISESRLAMEYRCVITDAYGEAVETDAAWMVQAEGLSIQEQPENYTGTVDELAVFSVKAEGGKSPYTYQWQYKSKTETSWKNSGATGNKTSEMKIGISAARLAFEYRCMVTDARGKSVCSNAAYMIAVVDPMEITSQPANYKGLLNETATFTVAVSKGMAPYTYQWQYKLKTDEEWSISGASGNKTAQMSLPISEKRIEMEYRCVITDATGEKITTNAACMVLGESLAVDTQPENFTGAIDEEAVFHVVARGGTAPYTYQWQYKAKTATEWKTSGAPGNKTDTMSLAISTARLSNEYRCKITDAKGRTVTSKAAFMMLRTDPMKVTMQPENFTGFIGDTAKFTVKATGGLAPYTYQWQYKVKTDESWTNSGATGNKTSTMSIAISANRMTMEYRCVITDTYGNKVESEAAWMEQAAELSISVQPENYEGAFDEVSVFSVEVEGGKAPYTYQWQYKAKTATEWKSSGASGNKTAAMSLPISVARLANEYRCKVTDARGVSIYSKAVYMIAKVDPLEIVSQPENYKGLMGENASFAVKATGGLAPYTYQWQYKVKTDESWTNSGAAGNKTDTMSIDISESRLQMEYRCVITDANGNTIESDAACMEQGEELTIAAQPENATGDFGEMATFTVEVTGGKEPYTYQWQHNNNGAGWTNSGATGNKTPEMSIGITEARLTMEYRCVITDARGVSVTTDAVHMIHFEKLNIVEQPGDVYDLYGKPVAFAVLVSGGTQPYTYQWQKLEPGAADWQNATEEGNDTYKLSVTISEEDKDTVYRCVITDAEGETVTTRNVQANHRTIIIDGVEYDNWEDANNNVQVIGYHGSETTVTVLAEVSGLPVTHIADSAFEGATNLVSIDLPDTIVVIGKRAFADCTNLSNMN